MGLIREPRNVDFYVIDKVWSEKELKELSELIKTQKDQKQTKKLNHNKLKAVLT